MKGWASLWQLFGNISFIVGMLKFPWNGPSDGSLEQTARALFWMMFGVMWHLDAIMSTMAKADKCTSPKA